jgi:hypothetical protein
LRPPLIRTIRPCACQAMTTNVERASDDPLSWKDWRVAIETRLSRAQRDDEDSQGPSRRDFLEAELAAAEAGLADYTPETPNEPACSFVRPRSRSRTNLNAGLSLSCSRDIRASACGGAAGWCRSSSSAAAFDQDGLHDPVDLGQILRRGI